MFHASGWTFPWAITFAAAAQVGSSLCPSHRNVGLTGCFTPSLANPAFHSFEGLPQICVVPAHLEPPHQLRRDALLRGADSTGPSASSLADLAVRALLLFWNGKSADTECGPTQIGLINAPLARRLERQVYAIIAGSAPTAHLIGELEKRNIKPVHVYGLTYVFIFPVASPSMRTLTSTCFVLDDDVGAPQ